MKGFQNCRKIYSVILFPLYLSKSLRPILDKCKPISHGIDGAKLYLLKIKIQTGLILIDENEDI